MRRCHDSQKGVPVGGHASPRAALIYQHASREREREITEALSRRVEAIRRSDLARALGAAVRKNGLLTPCQLTLPPVSDGRYEMPVMSASQAYGCGAPGAEIVLWTYAHDKQYFSTRTVAWPEDGHTATFDATFATAMPDGAAGPRTEFAGEIFDRGGRLLPDGTRIDAYVGDTLCGVASVRTYDDFTGFSLTVVGQRRSPGAPRERRCTSVSADSGRSTRPSTTSRAIRHSTCTCPSRYTHVTCAYSRVATARGLWRQAIEPRHQPCKP